MTISKNLEDVIYEKISRGYNVSGKNQDESTTKIRVINNKDIIDGRVNSEEPEMLGIPEGTDLSRYLLRPGDVILTLKSPFKVALISEKEKNSVANQNMVVMTPNPEIIRPEIFVEFLNSEHGQKQIKSVAAGSIILSIPVSAIKSLKIPIPPMDIQEKIWGFLSSSYQYLEELEAERKSLTDIKNGVIRRYLK